MGLEGFMAELSLARAAMDSLHSFPIYLTHPQQPLIESPCLRVSEKRSPNIPSTPGYHQPCWQGHPWLLPRLCCSPGH